MRDAFVPLAQWLQPPEPREPEAANPILPSEPREETGVDAALADVRRFRAALADALDGAVHDLLREIATDVVARELRMQPADIAAVVRRARERFAAEEPLALRVHPDDACALTGGDLPVIADSELRRGDVVLGVRSGTIDASLGARLDAVLAALHDA